MIMQIKPIKTEADYEAALKEIEQLWGTSYGSPEGDKLDVLVTLKVKQGKKVGWCWYFGYRFPTGRSGCHRSQPNRKAKG